MMTSKAVLTFLIIIIATTAASASPTCPKNDGRNCNTEAEAAAGSTDGPSSSSYCSLYMAESAVHSGRWGLFSGVDSSAGDGIFNDNNNNTNDLLIPILDANKNEYSPWHDHVYGPNTNKFPPQVLMESNYLNDVFAPGIASMISCSNKYVNVVSVTDNADLNNNNNVHRSKDPGAGSFSYYQDTAYYQLSRDVKAGEELAVGCKDLGYGEDVETSGRQVMSLEFLQETAICIQQSQTLKIGHRQSKSAAAAARGAFAAQFIKQGYIIATSPVIHFDRSQMEIVQQSVYPEDFDLLDVKRYHGIHYNSSKVLGKQLLLNYCYGHKDSDVLLLPYAPIVNYINHGSSSSSSSSGAVEAEASATMKTKTTASAADASTTANAYIRWSTHERAKASHMKSQRPMSLFSIPASENELLVFEYVATRDIAPDEEILIDYGEDWVKEWEAHREQWKPSDEDHKYVSAADFYRQTLGNNDSVGDPLSLLRTVEEQANNPYPENLDTACYFTPSSEDLEEEGSDEDDIVVEWSVEHFGYCLRPCDIEARYRISNQQQEEGDVDDDNLDVVTEYTVVVYESENQGLSESCGVIPSGGILVMRVPSNAVRVIDAPYTSDVHLQNAFRHEIGLPDGFLPKAWDTKEPDPMGDFMPTKLQPGQLDQIRWKETGEIVTQWAFRMGLTERIRLVLLDYSNKMGITKLLRHVTVEGNGLKPGKEAYVELDGDQWYIQRPDSYWTSNLHWLSPGGNPAHENYLQALGVAGFDDILKGLGEQLNMDGLVAFHVTFIAVSQSTKGYIHQDIGGTGGKVFNMIVPLILANDTCPELDIQDSDEPYDIGRYKYEYDVAALNGDDSYHGTSAVDYRKNKEVRIAATIYVADVNEDNVDRIMLDYTQAYPPQDRDLLMSWAGRHWKRDDPSVKLPEPPSDHILVRDESANDEDLDDEDEFESDDEDDDDGATTMEEQLDRGTTSTARMD